MALRLEIQAFVVLPDHFLLQRCAKLLEKLFAEGVALYSPLCVCLLCKVSASPASEREEGQGAWLACSCRGNPSPEIPWCQINGACSSLNYYCMPP